MNKPIHRIHVRNCLIQVLRLCCFCSLSLSCSVQKNKAQYSCGIIKYALKKFDKQTNEYITDETFWQNPRIWYKDSLAIEEIKGVTIQQEANGKETRSVAVMHFTFIDIPSRSLYEYTSFSDTARLLRKYTQPDSVIVPGGWTFYAPAKEYPGYDLPETMSDTSINGVLYRRMRIKYTNPSLPWQAKQIYVAYFRCDKKDQMIFSLVKDFGEKLGCPCTRLDEMVPSDVISLSQQIEFVADKLTAEEIKVFDTWEKNAKNNPVIR